MAKKTKKDPYECFYPLIGILFIILLALGIASFCDGISEATRHDSGCKNYSIVDYSPTRALGCFLGKRRFNLDKEKTND